MSASVFPARAGMSRACHVIGANQKRVPRASGDEPLETPYTTVPAECSPRERG